MRGRSLGVELRGRRDEQVGHRLRLQCGGVGSARERTQTHAARTRMAEQLAQHAVHLLAELSSRHEYDAAHPGGTLLWRGARQPVLPREDLL